MIIKDHHHFVFRLVWNILNNNKRNARIKMPEVSPEEWVLAFVYAGNPANPEDIEIKGKLLLTKEFFVFIKEIMPRLDSFFKFIPYDYGPFSFSLASTLDNLKNNGLIAVSTIPLPSGIRYDYKLTNDGILLAREIYKKIDSDIKKRLEKLRCDATQMGYFPVLSYVYSKYPEYTTASKIREMVT